MAPARVEREPEDYEPPYERCCVCNKQTPYWSIEKDVPLCVPCADISREEDIPTKDEWIKNSAQRETLMQTPAIGQVC